MHRYIERVIGFSAAAAVGLGLGYMSSYPPPRYNSETELIPDSQSARDLVKKCKATTGYGNGDFNSSWRFSMMGGDVAFFYCNVEEKIDWRERERLDFCADNPAQRYNWTTRIEW